MILEDFILFVLYRYLMFVIGDIGRYFFLFDFCMMYFKWEIIDYEYFERIFFGYIKDDMVKIWGFDGEKVFINGYRG